MSSSWTRRQFLTRTGVAVAAIQTFENLDPCCVYAADAPTSREELFELKPVADGVYAAIASARYKVNCNAAVILTDYGVVVVDSHSKPSAAYALYKQIQAITQQPIRKIINTHFHWDHWQGNQVYAEAYPDLEIIASERTRENLTRPDAGGGGIPYIEKQIASVPKEIDKLKEEIARSIEPERIVGCVVYCSAEIVEPGVIRHTEGNRISLGEPVLPFRFHTSHPGCVSNSRMTCLTRVCFGRTCAPGASTCGKAGQASSPRRTQTPIPSLY
jgi:hypothetical protein